MIAPQNISFPFSPLNSQGKLAWATDNQSMKDVIWNILLTRPGERLMRPEFGAGLQNFIHHPNNETTRRLIADVATKAINRWEPRIELTELTVEMNPQQLNRVTLNIHYRLKYNSQQHTMELGLEVQS